MHSATLYRENWYVFKVSPINKPIFKLFMKYRFNLNYIQKSRGHVEIATSSSSLTENSTTARNIITKLIELFSMPRTN